MSFLYTMLGVALGCLLVLVVNPLQAIPRFLRPVRYASAKRISQRVLAEWPIKRDFWLLSALSMLVLALLFLVSMRVPVETELLPLRFALGLAAGAIWAYGWLRRHEILISHLGIVGLYPNSKLVVSWAELSGYLVDEQNASLWLLNQQGLAVESLPFSGSRDLQELELALYPYLSRHARDEASGKLPVHVIRSLRLGLCMLLLSVAPLVGCFVQMERGYPPADRLLQLAILAALLLPLAILNWSLRFRLVYYGSLGHVQVAHLTSPCQRCHYEAVCWRSGLQRALRWEPGMAPVAPPYEEFIRQYRQGPELTPELYEVCCRCLVAHLEEQDIYHVHLRPLVQ